MVRNQKLAAVGVLAGIAAFGFGAGSAQADCTPEWTEEVGLPSHYRAWVWDLEAFNDGTGETLYAAGFFDTGPAIDARTVALRWDGETWLPLELQGAGNHGASHMLAVYNGQLVAGGDYTIDGDRYRVIRWDATAGDWAPMSGVNPSGSTLTPDVMVAFDGSLYIGGRHNHPQGLGAAYFSRFNGTSWNSVPNLPGALSFSNVRDLVVFDGSLYAAFGSVFEAGSVYRLDSDGGPWTKVGGVVPALSKMAVYDNHLYIAGTNGWNPPLSDYVMRLVDGEWEAVPSPTGFEFAEVETLAAANDGSGEALFVGGSFEEFAGVSANHVIKWDGQNWSALGGGVLDEDQDFWDARVLALVGWHGALWVGGEFEFVDTGSSVLVSGGVARWACEAAAVDPYMSTVVVAETAISSFGGITRITVTPRDADGQMLDAGQEVVLSIDGGTLLGSLSDQGDGTYRQYLQGSTSIAGTQVWASVNGIDLADAPFVAFVPVEPSLSAIDLSVDQTFVGGTVVVTVALLDDQGLSAGSGFDVQIATTVGDLVGSVIDHGDGTYSQTIIADETGTASITATVDGMALNTSAALSVLDPANIGNVIGLDGQGNLVGFLSIQAAIDAATPGGTVFIAPGIYNETILLDGAHDLIIEGLSALEPVTLRGVVISDSSEVSLRYLTIDLDGANRPRDAVELRGGPRASDGVEIIGSTIANATGNGVSVERGNNNVRIIDSVIAGNGRHGIEFGRGGAGHLVENSTVSDNGWTGVEIDWDVAVTLAGNAIAGNGWWFNSPNPNGHGISRARHGASGAPEQVTLINNTLANNNGQTHEGRSDSDIRNYDQIIDATDEQSPYTD